MHMMVPTGQTPSDVARASASAAPADVTIDIGNRPRATLQEQGTTQIAGLQVPGVQTIRIAAGLNMPVVEAPEPVPGGMETSCDL
jgi:hypothetical protein